MLNGSIQIETLELSFAVFVSVSEEDSATVAVFVMVVPTVPAFTVAVIVRVAVELAETVPTFHEPVELEYEPCEVVAETKVNPAGNVSVATTPVDVAGPRSVTETVKCTVPPSFVDVTSAVLLIERSAEGTAPHNCPFLAMPYAKLNGTFGYVYGLLSSNVAGAAP